MKSSPPKQAARDDWMSMTGIFKTFSKDDLKKDSNQNKPNKTIENLYDPSKSARELNPYWKNDGTGLPSLPPDRYDEKKEYSKHHYDKTGNKPHFKKPSFDDNKYKRSEYDESYSKNWKSDRNWKKETKPVEKKDYEKIDTEIPQSTSKIEINEEKPNDLYLNDDQMNKLGARIVKAEIMGDTRLVSELKQKLEDARTYRKENPLASSSTRNDSAVMLTVTDAKGNIRPLNKSKNDSQRSRKKNIDTHSTSGDRVRYFNDDDKYSLKDMVKLFHIIFYFQQHLINTDSFIYFSLRKKSSVMLTMIRKNLQKLWVNIKMSMTIWKIYLLVQLQRINPMKNLMSK